MGDQQVEFRKAVEEVVTPELARLSFLLSESALRENFSRFIWRRGECYVSLGASTYPTDYPFPLYSSMGIGTHVGEESAYNSIPLWWLLKQSTDIHRDDILLLPLRNIEEKLSDVLSTMKSSSLDFFVGTAEHFIELRKRYVRERGPLGFSVQEWHGIAHSYTDERSKELWKRFC